MKLVRFLKNYDYVLFDMDGVITSEERYWDCTALACYEMMFSKNYYGNFTLTADVMQKNLRSIREDVFLKDRTFKMLKNCGVNSNWDIGFIMLSISLIHKTTDYVQLYDIIRELNMDAMQIYNYIEGKTGEVRGGKLWTAYVENFQEWYLGDELNIKFYKKEPMLSGKNGLLQNEAPIIHMDRLHSVLSAMYDAGLTLGIGTGRVEYEASRPLDNWDIRKYFDKNRIITYSDIQKAEQTIKDVILTKPHPYMFLKGYCGRDYSDRKIVDGDYDKSKLSRTLVVGDAGADIFAAQAAGMGFCAVLTGVAGSKGRGFFTKNKANHIVESVADFVKE